MSLGEKSVSAAKSTPRARALLALRDWLEKSDLKPGDSLPSERELCKQLGVSLSTLHRASKALEVEGRLRQLGGRTRVLTEPSQGQAKLLRYTMAVLAPSRRPSSEHRVPGWNEYVSIGAFNAIEAAGYHALAFHPKRRHGEDLDDLIDARPLGVVIPEVVNPQLPVRDLLVRLRAAGIGSSLLGDPPEMQDFDRVISDHVHGAAAVTNWMIARGRKRILQILPPTPDRYWVQMRRQGYEKAMREAGLEILPALTPMPFADDAGRRETPEFFQAHTAYCAGTLYPLLHNKNPVDAILIAGDGFVPPFAAACRLLGKTPNVDVFLAGYDHYWTDIPERVYEQTPPMVTVDRNNLLIGQELVKLILDRAESRLTGPAQRRMIQPMLIEIPSEPTALPDRAAAARADTARL